MRIGAIVTLAGESQQAPGQVPAQNGDARSSVSTSHALFGLPIAACDVLGQNLLERTLARLSSYGVEQLSVIAEGTQSWYRTSDSGTVLEPGANFWSTWDSVVSRYLEHGIEHLLLVRLGAYVELDVADMIRFHRQTSSPLTQAHDRQGALDLVLVDAARLRQGTGSFRGRLSAMIPARRRYRFDGYSNRLASVADYRRLVRDALLGRCELRPRGEETRPGVWVGSGARIEPSAQIEAPAYIGEGVRIRSASVISGASAIERRSEVDCGTVVDGCCILPETYVGMGLRVANSVVAGSRLFHLERKIEVHMDERLLGPVGQMQRRLSQSLVKRAASLLPRNGRLEPAVASTRSSQLASLVTSFWSGNFE